MPFQIDGIEYFTATDLQQELGTVRQTLWRWRKAGKIPRGRRYRDRQILFTRQEVVAIRQYANRLEPAEPTNKDQLKPIEHNLAAGKRTMRGGVRRKN